MLKKSDARDEIFFKKKRSRAERDPSFQKQHKTEQQTTTNKREREKSEKT